MAKIDTLDMEQFSYSCIYCGDVRRMTFSHSILEETHKANNYIKKPCQGCGAERIFLLDKKPMAITVANYLLKD